MEFTFDKLGDPGIFQEGCVTPHSDHEYFRTEAEAEAGKSSFRLDLNGLWKFHYAKNPAQTVPGFQTPEFSCDGWDQIRVPGHLQLQGYDAPKYVNTQYPWEGHEQLAPGEIPTRFNPVGSYVRTFSIPREMEGLRSFLVLEGAESAAAVWLNGTYLGYHEDSFTPAEFELSQALVPGENKLAVQVFKWCAGSWCEDQDFFRFSGLFRDVYVRAIPETHVWDLNVSSRWYDAMNSAEILLDAELMGVGSVTVRLLYEDQCVWEATKSGSGRLSFSGEIDSPLLWSAEQPNLYDCELTVRNSAGAVTEVIREKVGIRQFELRDGIMLLNGQRIVFNGVNRHEFNSLRGRALRKEDIEQDLRIIKQNNINAIRTSHYPNSSVFYRLCDEYGIYVIDETNLETHGTWDYPGADRETILPGDHDEWRELLLARARAMLARDRNHPSVLIWSCGNESFGGSVIRDMAELFRKNDPSRLVHYEGISLDRRYPNTSDMESQMYTPVAKIEEFLEKHPEKPFLCCEYSHAMGNSCGALWKYTDLSRRKERYQGGFIWDFADQALWTKNRFGEAYLGYGGDFDDRPNDGSFSGDGLVSGDRRISPKMQEVKFLYQPIGIRVLADRVEIENRNLFVSTAGWECRVEVKRFGEVVETQLLRTDVQPLDRASYPLELRKQHRPGCYTVTVSFHLRTDESWGQKGHEVAFGQYLYEIPAPESEETQPLEIIESPHSIGFRGREFEAVFSKLSMTLVSYRWGERELLDGAPAPNFWRAPTDNDRGNAMPARYGQWKLASLYASPVRVTEEGSERMPFSFVRRPNSAVIRQRYWLPTRPEGFCELQWEIFGSGKIEVSMNYRPVDGLGEMPEFGMLFPLKAELGELSWYGLGPMETYADRKCGGRTDLFHNRVEENLAPYLVPQECGNKEDVRFAEVTGRDGIGVRFEADGCCFSALPYSPHQLEEARHEWELPRQIRTYVRIAMAQMGVAGDDTWGARTHPEYLLPNDRDLNFRFSFRGISR